jgi:surface antigen
MAILGAVAFVVMLGASSPSNSFADGNHFFAGYCTWDAAEQAHGAWGVWLPWYGDAGDWIDGARASGWRVSAVPQMDSIVVLPRGVQGSGAYGHVAWVLSVEQDGATVMVRSMDWSGRGVVTIHELRADGDAQFVTPPD